MKNKIFNTIIKNFMESESNINMNAIFVQKRDGSKEDEIPGQEPPRSGVSGSHEPVVNDPEPAEDRETQDPGNEARDPLHQGSGKDTAIRGRV